MSELKLKNQCNKFLTNFGVSDIEYALCQRDETRYDPCQLSLASEAEKKRVNQSEGFEYHIYKLDIYKLAN
jgi:hypothetical protein